MLSSALGSASSVDRPEWALNWRRSQVINEYDTVCNDYKIFMQELAGKMKAVRLRRSSSDARPCDALRRYVKRAEAHAAERQPAMRRTRWGALRPAWVPEELQPMPALRLFALVDGGPT